MSFGRKQQHTSGPTQLEYLYRPPIIMLLVAIFFFGLCTFFLVCIGITEGAAPTHGLDAAVHTLKEIKYWVCAALGAGMTLVAILCLFATLTADDDGMLRLTNTEMQIPYGYVRRKVRVIPFRDVTGIRRFAIQKHPFFDVKYTGGKVTINPKWLHEANAFEKICAFIETRAVKERK